MPQGRVYKVAEQIRKKIGEIIHDKVKDPRVGFVTITRVELSRDLRVAKVYFSLLGSKKQLTDTQIGLQSSSGFIRKLLNQRVRLRYSPELVFKLDENIEYSIHISEILEKINKEGKSDGATTDNQSDKEAL